MEFSDKRFATSWGSSDIVKATAHYLIRITETHDSDYVILMSESDYPVKSADYISSYLSDKLKDYALSRPLPCDNPIGNPGGYWIEGGMRRVKGYAVRFGAKGIATIEPRKLNWGNMRQFGKLLMKALSKLKEACEDWLKKPRQCPAGVRWCGGDQWFILRMSTIRKMVGYMEHDDTILKEADYTDCPDEITFATLVDAFAEIARYENRTLRYIHWPEGKSDSPAYMTMREHTIVDMQIADPDILFVRKVEDAKVAEYIDKLILQD